MIIVSLLCALAAAQAHNHASLAETETAGVRLVLSELKTDANCLTLDYEIRNTSGHNIWLCQGIHWYVDFEAYIDDDKETLTIRRRLDVPTDVGWGGPPRGTYGRLRSGQSRSESIWFALPIRVVTTFHSPGGSCDGIIHSRKLAIELGFYDCDLPNMVLETLAEAEKARFRYRDLLDHIGGPLMFTASNEHIADRDQAMTVNYNGQKLKPEQVVRVAIEDVNIPYVGRYEWGATVPKLPDLADCTRLTIAYEPSMLEYLFPSPGRQSLLNSEEKAYLQQQKATVVDEAQQVGAFCSDIKRGHLGAVVGAGSSAHVVCYQDDKARASFTIYGDSRLVTEDKDQFMYVDGIPSLRPLAKAAVPFQLRADCAANLSNLWWRLHSYYRSKDAQSGRPSGTPRYPAAARWADDIVAAYGRVLGQGGSMEAFRCPDSNDGKSHYAMNADCRYESPGDVVLLFETKAGWNQHGGPELFTFDNHDPKGGLVLLNDGTVKFIRTEEELKQLRWK